MSIDLDRRYVGKINPDDTRTLWRIDTHGGTAVPPIAWAGDGQPDWGSAHDPSRQAGELDCALAILADHLGDPAAAFANAERLATQILAHTQPTSELVVHETVLHSFDDRPVEFRADATPVRDLLAATIADTGDPLHTAASGLGLDPEWAEQIASGDITHLSVDEVRHVCQRLYVTPPDLWRPDEAAVIEGFWPASQWPTAQAIDLDHPITTVTPDTTWHQAIEPAATLAPEVSLA